MIMYSAASRNTRRYETTSYQHTTCSIEHKRVPRIALYVFFSCHRVLRPQFSPPSEASYCHTLHAVLPHTRCGLRYFLLLLGPATYLSVQDFQNNLLHKLSNGADRMIISGVPEIMNVLAP